MIVLYADRVPAVCSASSPRACGTDDIFNPLRMRSRVTVVVLCVCVCVSVTTLVARGLISAVQAWYQQDTSKVFNSWISLKRFVQSYGVIYLAIGAAIV